MIRVVFSFLFFSFFLSRSLQLFHSFWFSFRRDSGVITEREEQFLRANYRTRYMRRRKCFSRGEENDNGLDSSRDCVATHRELRTSEFVFGSGWKQEGVKLTRKGDRRRVPKFLSCVQTLTSRGIFQYRNAIKRSKRPIRNFSRVYAYVFQNEDYLSES